jgi:hypothetical protein
MEIQTVLSFGFIQCGDWKGKRANSKILRKKTSVYSSFVLILDRISSSRKCYYLQRTLSPTIRLFQPSCCSVELLLLLLLLLLLYAHVYNLSVVRTREDPKITGI